MLGSNLSEVLGGGETFLRWPLQHLGIHSSICVACVTFNFMFRSDEGDSADMSVVASRCCSSGLALVDDDRDPLVEGLRFWFANKDPVYAQFL